MLKKSVKCTNIKSKQETENKLIYFILYLKKIPDQNYSCSSSRYRTTRIRIVCFPAGLKFVNAFLNVFFMPHMYVVVALCVRCYGNIYTLAFSSYYILISRFHSKSNQNQKLKTTFGRTTMTTSQELDRAQERADKAAAELRRTQAELRVTQVQCLSPIYHIYNPYIITIIYIRIYYAYMYVFISECSLV